MVFECLICDYKTEIKFNYQKHLKTNKHLLNFKKCGKKYENVEKSINDVEKSINLFENNTNKISNTHLFSCQWCKRNFGRNDSLKRHLRSCDKYNSQKFSEIITNYQNNSTNDISHVCSICFKQCSNKYNLKRHYNRCQEINEEKNVEKSMIKPFLKATIVSTVKHNNYTTEFKDHEFTCKYCNNKYSHQRSLSRHYNSCAERKLQIENIQSNKDREIEKILYKKEIEKEKLLNDYNLQLLNEKDKRIADKQETIEIAKQSKVININNTSNKTINFLNTHFGGMIVMEQFLTNLEKTEKLTLQERQNLLLSYQEGGIDVFARNFSYIMKQNCKRQLENQGLEDMKLLPLFCSDGNLRSHKEKQDNGWKTLYDNQSINRMLNISNDQIHESCQQVVPISGKERTKIYKEIKKDNHQNKFLQLENKNN